MIGFDIGGTKCAVCIGQEVDGDLQILDKKSILTDHTISPYEMIDRMCALAETMTDTIDCIGISCGGPLNSKTGVIQSPPNLPGWDNVEIVAYLEKRYGAKAYLQNDANACAVAEWKYGAGKGTKHMIFLTFGTGLGAGLILNGKLYRGASDMAGEVGHIRLTEDGPIGYGKRGSFEGYCSGGGIAQIAKKKAQELLSDGKRASFVNGSLDAITAKDVALSAEAGHEDALEVFRISGRYFGKGLSILIDILNPEVIVAGSIYARSGHLFREEMEKEISKEALSYSRDVCRILPAKLGDSIGDYAAVVAAIG